MLVNQREVSENEITLKINSKRGMYRLVSNSQYYDMDDAKKIKEMIILNYQITETIIELRELDFIKGKFYSFSSNRETELRNRLELLLNKISKLNSKTKVSESK